MQVKQRLFSGTGLISLAIFTILCALLWQQQVNAQREWQKNWTSWLSTAWIAEQALQQEILIRALKKSTHPHPSQEQLNTAIHGNEPVFIDVLDQQGRIIFSSSPYAAQNPLQFQNITSSALENGQVFLHALQPDQYIWISMQHSHGFTWLASRSANSSIKTLEANLGGSLFLQNLWANSAQNICTNNPRSAFKNTRCFSSLGLVSLPISGLNQRTVAHLEWHPSEADAQTQSLQSIAKYGLLFICLACLFLLAAVYAFFRHTLAPLSQSIGALEQLSQGKFNIHLDNAETDTDGEVCMLARNVQKIRRELIQLETLRQERVRLRIQHERLIRSELRNLAESLDPASREEILKTLQHEPQQAEPYASNKSASGLAELASVLGRMSGLVSTQQNRLLKLLKELQASMQTQALLASLQQELEIARQMQLSILPRETPNTRHVSIDATMIPAKEVGGDFYDYFFIDEDHLAIVVADVSGKGVPAAFFMAISRTLLKSNAMHLQTPSATIASLNDQLCAENEQMMFVTVFYAVLELSTGVLRYVNAGHNPPICTLKKEVNFLATRKNMALAVMEEQDFAAGEICLAPGDSIVLYTDGVTEATNTSQELFGDARLLEAIRATTFSQGVPDTLITRIRDFEQGAPQADDITVVALRYIGSPQ